MYWRQFEVLIMHFFFLSLNEFLFLQIADTASKSERDALFVAADSQSHHTIFVAPPYMTLFKQITQIRFQCYIDGQPAREGQTLWMRDELSVPCNMSNRVFACGNIIIITKVSKQDAGKYKCVNQDGTFFVVAVYVPASMRDTKDEMLTLYKGENRNLDCFVRNYSYPPASVFWKHNGSYIASGASLHLRGLDQNQTGTYECTAFNGYGIPVSKKFYVSIVKASVPINLEGTDASSASLANHPFCLAVYMTLCLTKKTITHFMF